MKKKQTKRLLAALTAVLLLLGTLAVTVSSNESRALRGTKFGLKGACLHLNEDINVVYLADLPSGCTDAYMEFTMCGITTTVTSYTVAEDGSCCFEFADISPVQMADNISATLYATVNGVQQSAVASEYSIKTYCTRILERYSDNAALVALLSDLLAYGDAAQLFAGYHTEQLASDGVDTAPSIFPGIRGYRVLLSGTESSQADWEAATLLLANDLAVRLFFTAPSVEGLTVRVSLDGRTQDFTAADFAAAGSNRYSITFGGVKATEFDDTLSASFYRSGAQLGRTLGYSVNTYICNYYNTATAQTAFRQLLEALYNYGESAAAYNEQLNPSDDPDAGRPWITVQTGLIDTEGWQTMIP